MDLGWTDPSALNDAEPFPEGRTARCLAEMARKFRVWIASASNVGWMTGGPWKGWKGIGCSMVISPDGEQLLDAPYGVDADTLLYVDIKPESRPGRGTTWWQYWE